MQRYSFSYLSLKYMWIHFDVWKILLEIFSEHSFKIKIFTNAVTLFKTDFNRYILLMEKFLALYLTKLVMQFALLEARGLYYKHHCFILDMREYTGWVLNISNSFHALQMHLSTFGVPV
jgi:hypothetical protein